MTAHSYSLRSRISSSSLTTKTPNQSPVSKPSRSPKKTSSLPSTLQLKHVIGTTTSNASGISCCATSNSYAYCAGSVAVLATFSDDGTITYRYFKARPTTSSINQTISYYSSPSNSNTPTRRRPTLHGGKTVDDSGSGFFSRHWHEEGPGQTWSARERIKAASCVSISPDGKLLAVGETGYNPRVLLFSTAANVPTDVPLSIITDHTIGIRCVSFSPDSKYLATLGDINDGFLYIWTVNTKTGVVKLISSNKCTTNVCDMTWCGHNVITVGTRHIKIWQASNHGNSHSSRKSRIKHEGEIASPGPTPLQGRNCLLGTFVDATFTAVVAISRDRAIVCADDGNICSLDLSQGRTDLSLFERTEKTIAAVSYRQDPHQLIWIGDGGLLEERSLDFDRTSNTGCDFDTSAVPSQKSSRASRPSLLRQSLGLSPIKLANTVAICCLKEKVISIDAKGTIHLSKPSAHDSKSDDHKVVSHDGPVRGIQKLPKESGLGDFFTWDRSGELHFWKSNGDHLQTANIDLDDNNEAPDNSTNEMKVVRYSAERKIFIVGDQFGVLKVIEQDTWTCLNTIRAHSAEITDIDVRGHDGLAATCSRDRMVQIFVLKEHHLDLLQTSDDHISAVNQVLFSQNGNRLLSCSSDRTIVVRERIERNTDGEITCAFISARTITMKAAPLSMSILPHRPDNLVIATLDRRVVQVDLGTGAVLSSFKVSDQESDDTVSLNTLCLSESTAIDGGYLLVGISAIDKSIRLYDLGKGTLLGRDSGHIEGVSDVTMLREQPQDGQVEQIAIVSTGLDGTIMIWSVTAGGQPLLTPQQELSESQMLGTDPEKSCLSASPASLPPLRKILSKMDIAEFTRHTSPTREVSPNGLRRKTSRLALATSVEEVDEGKPTAVIRNRSQERRAQLQERSTSPGEPSTMMPRKQRSRPEIIRAESSKSANVAQSPSVPTTSVTLPTAPRHTSKNTQHRLRRFPSVPNDLRTQSTIQERRQSIGTTSDVGSISMATDQVSRMLKAYKKKLQATRINVDLNDVESDLEAVLKVIRQKKAKMGLTVEGIETNVLREDIENDMNGLSILLEKAKVS